VAKIREEEEAAGSSQVVVNPNVCQNIAYMCKHTTLRNNLIAMCCIWSVSGFSFYLIDFYVKFFPGSVFFNKGFFGLCDASAILYIKVLEKKLVTVPLVIRFALVMVILFSLIYMVLANSYLFLIPVMVGLTRLQINAILAYSYHVNQFLFPTLMRGAAYSMTNFVSRPFIGMATIITEYTKNPMVIVCILSILNMGTTFMISEPADE